MASNLSLIPHWANSWQQIPAGKYPDSVTAYRPDGTQYTTQYIIVSGLIILGLEDASRDKVEIKWKDVEL